MTTAEWLDIGWVDQIPVRGSRTVQVEGGDDIAVFRTAEGKVFALLDRCPHKHGRLSQASSMAARSPARSTIGGSACRAAKR